MWLLLAGLVVVAIGFVAFTGAPYVPSKRRDIEQALTKLYPVGDDDVLVDIGSGDGVVLRVARRCGVGRAVGYEIHPVLVMVSRWLSRHDPGVEVRMANLWHQPLPDDTTVVYTFGDSRDITKMYQLVQREASRLDRSLAFLSYWFAVPSVRETKKRGAHYLYTVHPLQALATPV